MALPHSVVESAIYGYKATWGKSPILLRIILQGISLSLWPGWYILGDVESRRKGPDPQPGISGQKCILVAEDNEDDVVLLRLGLQKAGLSNRLSHVGNGEVALDYLAGEPPFSDREKHPFPDLLLLDLKMPRLDGLGLLKLMKAHPELSALPIVVLSSSLLKEDEQKARR